MPLSRLPIRPYGAPMRNSLDSGDFPLGGGGGTATRGGSTGCYVNPVLDEDFPDPSVILAPDGFYYAYATQTLRDGQWTNIQVARSSDLIHWQQLGDALPEKPSWAMQTQDFWAPFVVRKGDHYLMYYS